MKERLPYNKPKSGKILGGGGPRDQQQRRKNAGVLTGPKVDQNELAEIKKLIEEKVTAPVEVGSSFDGLPYDEVERKIQEAVHQTREEEAKRYGSGLESLNEQLNAAKVKIALMEKEFERVQSTSVDTELTRQAIVPFDLSDVARAFESGLASRFVHLGESSAPDDGSPTHIKEDNSGKAKNQ